MIERQKIQKKIDALSAKTVANGATREEELSAQQKIKELKEKYFSDKKKRSFNNEQIWGLALITPFLFFLMKQDIQRKHNDEIYKYYSKKHKEEERREKEKERRESELKMKEEEELSSFHQSILVGLLSFVFFFMVGCCTIGIEHIAGVIAMATLGGLGCFALVLIVDKVITEDSENINELVK